MKKTLLVIVAAIMLISLSACSAKPELGSENNLTDTAENRFLNYDFSAVSSPVKLNETAVPVKTELPSGYRFAEYNEEPQSMDDIMRMVTQVDIITITGIESFQSLTGDSDLDSMIGEKAGTASVITVTVFEAQVLYSLAGEIEDGQSIKIYYPAGDWGVELAEGKDYLVTLSEWGDSYKLTRDMNSVFDIDENFVITSQSSMTFPAKFNGLSLADASYLLCNNFETDVSDGEPVIIESNEIPKELSKIILKKSAKLSGKTLGIIDKGNQTALAVIFVTTN